MQRTPLTDLAVRAAKSPSSGTLTLMDSTVRGFGLRCSQGGTKTFIVILGKERSRVRIGHYPQWAVKDARQEALRIIADRAGKPARKRVSLIQAFEVFKQAHLSRYRPNARVGIERLLNRHLIRKYGTRSVADITTDELTRITDGLLDTPGTCSHVFAAFRLLFRWAVRRRLIDRSPLEGIEMPAPYIPRERVLRIVYRKTEVMRFCGGRIVQLLILTGQRRSEIAGLKADYIDRKSKTINFPANFTKNGRAHSFPYGDRAAAIIETLPTTGYLFPARGSDDQRPYSGWSKLKTHLEVPIAPWTLHDLRRTFATNLAMLDTLPHVVERILNHRSGTISGIAAIYNKHSYMEEMRQALQRYEIWLQAQLSKTEEKDDANLSTLHHERT